MQLLPIKLVPGYIAIDFVAGCINCNFCVAKRDDDIRNLFESGRREELCKSDDVFRLLNKMPSYHLARIPLRIGNDTDYAFQKKQTKDLIKRLPKDYPIVVLTRFPLSEKDVDFFKERKNILLKISITPKSSFLFPRQNANKLLNSIDGLVCKNVITFGPLVSDNIQRCIELITDYEFSPYSYVYLKSLDHDGLPWINHIKQPDKSRVILAKNALKENSIRHLTMILCPLLEELGRGDPRVVDIPADEKKYCCKCKSYDICYKEEKNTNEEILSFLKVVGIENIYSLENSGYKTIRLNVGVKTSIGDESFISYMVGQKVRFTNTIKALFDNDISNRWARSGFFPLEEIKAATNINLGNHHEI